MALAAVAVPAALAIDHVVTGAIDGSDPTQTAQLFQDSLRSTCADEGTNPGVTGTGSRHYDQYSFGNPNASRCVQVTVDAMTCTGTNSLFVGAYAPTFNPANVSQNWIGDIGSSPNPTDFFSFDAPIGFYRLVVSEVNENAGCPGYSMTVSTNPINHQGAITLSDPTQTARASRDGEPSTCPDEGTNPGPTGTGSRHYDQYSFHNPSAGPICVDVTTTAPDCIHFTVAYAPTFNPANVSQNWIGDAGLSGTVSFSFNAPPGDYHLVVSEVDENAGCTAYSLTVSSATPTAVGVLGFSGKRASGGGILLSWRTGSEDGILGFNLYREQAGKKVRVNANLLPVAQRPGTHVHAWLDRNAPRRAARYWLQEVAIDGSRAWRGTAMVAVGS